MYENFELYPILICLQISITGAWAGVGDPQLYDKTVVGQANQPIVRTGKQG